MLQRLQVCVEGHVEGSAEALIHMCLFSRIASRLRPTAFDVPPTRLPLLSFEAEKLARWQLQTDAPIGGFSEGTLDTIGDSPGSRRALWSGRTSLEVDRLVQQQFGKSDQKAVASKVGFVAMMQQLQEGQWELTEFHGLCLRCRPRDARNYVLTVRATGTLGDHRTEDLYQTLLQPFVAHAVPTDVTDHEDADSVARPVGGDGADEPLLDVRVPWGAFTLTWRGYVQGERPPAMHLDRINSVGLLLADKTAGEFCIELGGLSAFRYEEGEEARDEHVRRCLELNAQRGYDEREALG